MKKNLYYKTVFGRRNAIKEFILGFFLAFSNWPRMLLEVFIRRNLGERYFSFSGAIILLIVLAVLPVFTTYGFHMFSRYGQYSEGFSFWGFIGSKLTWYAFLAAFLFMCLKRREEVRRLPSVFDFARFSLSTGNIHPRFLSIRIAGKPADIRTIETLLEPAFFFGIGVMLWMMGQSVGTLLIVCSIFYSISYKAAYHLGDQFIMDQIDELICNEELVKSFVDGRDSSETRGFKFMGRRPANPEARQRVAESFLKNEETVEAY